jgi:hypothetical protein
MNQAANRIAVVVSRLAHFSAMKMKVKCSSETSTDFQQITGLYIPDKKTFQYLYWLQ